MVRSDLEYAFDTQWRVLGSDLPNPEINKPVIPGRRFRVDRSWASVKLAVELEGGAMGRKVHCHNCNVIVRSTKTDGSVGREIRAGGGHQTQRFFSDIEKYNLLTAHGWKLLRFTRKDVFENPFEMVNIIRTVIEKHSHPIDMLERLTKREEQVLYLIASGLVTGDIASRLGVSRNTIKGHAQNMCQKLCAKNRTAAVARAAAWGLIDFAKIPFPEDIILIK